MCVGLDFYLTLHVQASSFPLRLWTSYGGTSSSFGRIFRKTKHTLHISQSARSQYKLSALLLVREQLLQFCGRLQRRCSVWTDCRKAICYGRPVCMESHKCPRRVVTDELTPTLMIAHSEASMVVVCVSISGGMCVGHNVSCIVQ